MASPVAAGDSSTIPSEPIDGPGEADSGSRPGFRDVPWR